MVVSCRKHNLDCQKVTLSAIQHQTIRSCEKETNKMMKSKTHEIETDAVDYTT